MKKGRFIASKREDTRGKARGRFIVIEGVGGAGKTEQLKKASAYLKERKIKFVATREPGGVPEAELIRELIFDLKERKLSKSDHEIALFFAARKIWMKNIVIPNLEKGVHVISDRTYFSTAAYQGYGENGDTKSIEKISEVVVGEYKPDLVILLDVSLKTALARNSVNKDGDPYDYLSKKFFERVINGYRKMAKDKWGRVAWRVVDAEGSIDEVFLKVKRSLDKVLSLA